jgi:ribosomal protein L11 methyltransferase
LSTKRRVCDSTVVDVAWFEISVEVPTEHADAVSSFLFDQGTAGVEQEDGNTTALLRAYFDGEPPHRALRRFCAQLAGGSAAAAPPRINVRRLPDTDWTQRWKQEVQPLTVGTSLYVCPSWNAEPPPGRAAIVIDPGMAFGTGHHATTRACLLLLEEVTRSSRVRRALDFGTGSGILAIALARLGVGEVVAIDNDSTALEIAAANASRNGVLGAVEFTSTLEGVTGPFDLIVANLYSNLLAAEAVRMRDRLAAAGTLICSGFLEEDEPRVRDAYGRLGFVTRRRVQEGDWVSLALGRGGAA